MHVAYCYFCCIVYHQPLLGEHAQAFQGSALAASVLYTLGRIYVGKSRKSLSPNFRGTLDETCRCLDQRSTARSGQ